MAAPNQPWRVLVNFDLDHPSIWNHTHPNGTVENLHPALVEALVDVAHFVHKVINLLQHQSNEVLAGPFKYVLGDHNEGIRAKILGRFNTRLAWSILIS